MVIETWVALPCVRIKTPVEHTGPENPGVQAGSAEDGVTMLRMSHVADPPAARATVLKPTTGVEEKSLTVPVFPKSGSGLDTRSAVVLLHVAVFPEKAMQGGAVDTPNNDPTTLPIFTTPPPPSGMGVANTLVELIAIKASPIEAKPAIFRPI